MAYRRITVYFAWDKRTEAARSLGDLDNRFPALFELRRAAWPALEVLAKADQGIAGFLDRVVLGDFEQFFEMVRAETGARPRVVSRGDDAGGHCAIDEDLVADVDTLVVVGLDHATSSQVPSAAEVEAVRKFLRRSKTLLVACPHHWVGSADGANAGALFKRQLQEHAHHGDALVPAQQLLGGYVRALLDRIGLPVENSYGLKPASIDGRPAPLRVSRELDGLGLFGTVGAADEVSTFNAHGHLPHFVAVGPAVEAFRVLAWQQIDPAAPRHPFTDAGNREFQALLWAQGLRERAGDVVVCDATIWSAAFGGLESLSRFWRKVATLPT